MFATNCTGRGKRWASNHRVPDNNQPRMRRWLIRATRYKSIQGPKHTNQSINRATPAPPYPVGASRVKRFAPGFKTPICLSSEPLARNEFGGAWGGPFGTGFRAAPGRLFFGYFLLATAVNVGLHFIQPNLRACTSILNNKTALNRKNLTEWSITKAPTQIGTMQL